MSVWNTVNTHAGSSTSTWGVPKRSRARSEEVSDDEQLTPHENGSLATAGLGGNEGRRIKALTQLSFSSSTSSSTTSGSVFGTSPTSLPPAHPHFQPQQHALAHRPKGHLGEKYKFCHLTLCVQNNGSECSRGRGGRRNVDQSKPSPGRRSLSHRNQAGLRSRNRVMTFPVISTVRLLKHPILPLDDPFPKRRSMVFWLLYRVFVALYRSVSACQLLNFALFISPQFHACALERSSG